MHNDSRQLHQEANGIVGVSALGWVREQLLMLYVHWSRFHAHRAHERLSGSSLCPLTL